MSMKRKKGRATLPAPPDPDAPAWAYWTSKLSLTGCSSCL